MESAVQWEKGNGEEKQYITNADVESKWWWTNILNEVYEST